MGKILTLFLAITTLVTAAGCSKTAGSLSASSSAIVSMSASEVKKPITLKILWATENNWKGFETFQTLYTDETGNSIDIQYYPAAEYSTIITTKMMAAEGPDIFRTDGIGASEGQWPHEWFADLSGEKWVSRLNSSGKTAILWTNGDLNQAPTQPLGPIGMAYNKDTLTAAGVTTLPATWTEFLAACEKIKAIGKIPVNVQLASDNCFGMTQMMKSGWESIFVTRTADEAAKIIAGIKENTVKYADVPEFKTTIDEMIELRDKNLINKDYMATTMQMTSKRIGSGECGFSAGGEWMLTALVADYPNANIGIMPLPVGDKQGALFISQGVGMAANAKSKNLDAAKAFISKWCSQDWQIQYMKLNPGNSWFSDVTAVANKFTESVNYWGEKGLNFAGVNYGMIVFPEMESRPLVQELFQGKYNSKQYLDALYEASKVIATGKGLKGW